MKTFWRILRYTLITAAIMVALMFATVVGMGFYVMYKKDQAKWAVVDLHEVKFSLKHLVEQEKVFPAYTLDELVQKKVIHQASLDFMKKHQVTYFPFRSDDPDSTVVIEGTLQGRPFKMTKGDIIK